MKIELNLRRSRHVALKLTVAEVRHGLGRLKVPSSDGSKDSYIGDRIGI
jgi:hypothetical protein